MLYATNGSINITVVDGETHTGSYAADGSLNVVPVVYPVDEEDAPIPTAMGMYHPCGAINVTPTDGTVATRINHDGSLNITTEPNVPAQFVTDLTEVIEFPSG